MQNSLSPKSQEIYAGVPAVGVESLEESLRLIDDLKFFLATAPANWQENQVIRRYYLNHNEGFVSCVFWNNLYFVTGTDIVRCIVYRFEHFGREIVDRKKFEEGIFSDLRNLKCGTDSVLEAPKSDFLLFLYKNSCLRTQKKQKVFFWFSVPHDKLFADALERDLKREASKQPATTRARRVPALGFVFDEKKPLFEQVTEHLRETRAALPRLEEEKGEEYLPGNGPLVTDPLAAPAMGFSAIPHAPTPSLNPVIPHPMASHPTASHPTTESVMPPSLVAGFSSALGFTPQTATYPPVTDDDFPLDYFQATDGFPEDYPPMAEQPFERQDYLQTHPMDMCMPPMNPMMYNQMAMMGMEMMGMGYGMYMHPQFGGYSDMQSQQSSLFSPYGRGFPSLQAAAPVGMRGPREVPASFPSLTNRFRHAQSQRGITKPWQAPTVNPVAMNAALALQGRYEQDESVNPPEPTTRSAFTPSHNPSED